MKTTSQLLILAVSLYFSLASCSSNEISQPTGEIAHSHPDDEALQLNAGKKWKVDDHMMDELRELESIVNHANRKENTMSLDAIADSLIVHLDLLTSNCTMQGQAHDELHKWLVPFIELVNEYANYEKESVARQQLIEMKSRFLEFNTYFE
jgi:hypothetical protein